MTPANICSGFRKCGIYPFNPDAIDCTISTENPAGNVQGGAGDEMNEDEGGECSHSAEDSGTFSAEKEQLFQMRYEEDMIFLTKNIYSGSILIILMLFPKILKHQKLLQIFLILILQMIYSCLLIILH